MDNDINRGYDSWITLMYTPDASDRLNINININLSKSTNGIEYYANE